MSERWSVRILGNRGGVPTPRGACSGYLVETPDARLLLDCGPGVAGRFESTDDSTALDAILVSHLHMDHCYDLLPLGYIRYGYATMQARAGRQVTPVPLLLPEGGKELLEGLHAWFPVPTVPGLDNMFEEIFTARAYTMGGQVRLGRTTVTTVEMEHALPCAGFRIEAAGRVLAYTGDTGPTPALDDLAHDADVLLCETSFLEPDHLDHGHLSARQAGEAAAQAGVHHLVLTHFMGPPLGPVEDLERLRAEAAAAYDGPITLAAPGMRVDLAPADTPARATSA